jgi:dihydrofolate synthase/folylpolyglutamate synthase
MNYDQCVAYIESLAPTILNPSLDRLTMFMTEHGQVQDKLSTIHIGGTNGKGSTVAIVDSVLRAAGLKVGRFTGPHLLRWNERFHLDGKPIADDVLARYATRLRALSEEFGERHPEHGHLTWFEFLTAIAFFYFSDEKVDVAVFEVGLGGRWDATNVISKPLVSAITTVDLDHTHILGDTVAQIAREKAGIIKRGVPVVTAADGDALAEISEKAKDLGCPLYHCQAPNSVSGPAALDLNSYRNAHDLLALPGEYQQLNGLVAAAVLQLADRALKRNLSAHLADGFRRVYWPGRLQILPADDIVFDGAHNVAGARALRKSLDNLFPKGRRSFVLSFFQHKNVSGAIELLVRPGDRVFTSEAQTTRSICPAAEIVQLAEQRGAQATAYKTIAEALHAAQAAVAGADEPLVVSGSFATIKECMLALGWDRVEDGLAQTWRQGDWERSQPA